MTDTSLPLPELLAPAGSPEALEAALAAGADAVYLGGSAFNARMNAHNFDREELIRAVDTAHRQGGRVSLTLNTLIYDREMEEAVRAAYGAACAGVDGLIIADVGAAARIHAALPALPLHASTQLSGHTAAMGDVLAPFGFSRYVMARETAWEDLETAVRRSPLEVEVFVHGALCVCHSGQCLFSSMVGGRSGNRGECAQPCRLPYRNGNATSARKPEKETYPLSLKDLSLAGHVPALIRAGVASLKIEGRMKSAGYVGGVVSVWRRLLNERRAATEEEMRHLADLFSRGGFTDGYVTRRTDHTMMGIRSDGDKERSAETVKNANTSHPQSFLPLTLRAVVKENRPMTLTVSAPLFRQGTTESITVSVSGDIPQVATNPAAALTRETLVRQLSRAGGTAYRPDEGAWTVDMDPGLLLPLSRVNALRRQALDALENARMQAMPRPGSGYDVKKQPFPPPEPVDAPAVSVRTARFHRAEQMTPAAEDWLDIGYLPLFSWKPGQLPARRGVILPPVIFDSEADRVKTALTRVLTIGARDVLICNPGHFPLVRQVLQGLSSTLPVRLHGDFRLNITNVTAAVQMQRMAAAAGTELADLMLSPELTLPRLRDIHCALPGRVQTVVYGRLPLMLLEKCAIRELYPEAADPRKPDGAAGVACMVCAKGQAALKDRRGMVFPILREFDHRNLILNSVPLSMTDRPAELEAAHIHQQHFIFTTESPTAVDNVIRAAMTARPVGGEVRRIK